MKAMRSHHLAEEDLETLKPFLRDQGWRPHRTSLWNHERYGDDYNTRTAIRKSVDDLKDQWSSDPSWDIENTEGFDPFHDELLTYRLRMEGRWAIETEIADLQERREELEAEAKGLLRRQNDLEAALKIIPEL